MLIQRNRKVSGRYIYRIMNVRVDVKLLFPRTLRRILLGERE
jgi:hypothetical protein